MYVAGGVIPSLIPIGAALTGAKVAGSLGNLIPDSKLGKAAGNDHKNLVKNSIIDATIG